MRMFRNDYSEGAAPEILKALTDTNEEQCPGYTEGDVHCEHARALIREACGCPDADVEFCIGGTSTNVIAISGLLRDWEGVICTPIAHVCAHETGAVGATGRTILATQDKDGFVSPDEAERVWRYQTSTGRHMTRPGMVYITDTTEIAGVWTKERFFALCDWADSHELPVFLDGARLASALTSPANDLTLADIASRCAAFYLGGTKNGMLMGEALVIRNPRLKESFPYVVKERGGLLAKGRLLGVQFERAFMPEADGSEPLWFRYARTANDCAAKLHEGMVALGYESYGGADSNQLFFVVDTEEEEAFQKAAGSETFYTLDDGRKVIRFVTSWATTPSDVDELLAFAEQLRS